MGIGSLQDKRGPAPAGAADDACKDTADQSPFDSGHKM